MGLVIGSVTPRPGAEALDERGLAGAELAGQQDEVAGAAELGERGGQRAGLLGVAWCAARSSSARRSPRRLPAPARTSLARTKSARIWAIGSVAAAQHERRVEGRDEHARARYG